MQAIDPAREDGAQRVRPLADRRSVEESRISARDHARHFDGTSAGSRAQQLHGLDARRQRVPRDAHVGAIQRDARREERRELKRREWASGLRARDREIDAAIARLALDDENPWPGHCHEAIERRVAHVAEDAVGADGADH
jgi:hypothetical protein